MNLAIGTLSIKPKKTKDNKGREGFFLTKEEWGRVRSVIVKKEGSAKVKKKGLMPGMREALNEMRDDALGIKSLRNTNEPFVY